LKPAILAFLLASALVWPLYKIKYTNNWASIESTFIADGRFLKEHWPHPRWQPLWYLGTRFDYVYPPALRYGTASVSTLLGVLPVRGYHIYTAFFYAIGIAGVFVLVRAGTGSQGAAWAAAAAAAFCSPSFLFLTHIRGDAVFRWPQRLNALIRYGEGPHISALAVLPLALAAAWYGLRRGHPAALALAAVASALVVSNNFYGATALAMFFPAMVWALWITHRDRWILARAAAIAALAYGLTAFWLVPSYVQITLRNMRYVADPGNAWSLVVALAAAAVFAAISWKLAFGRPERAWPLFVGGAAAIFSLNVLGYYYFKLLVIGVPERMVPELDLALILVGVEVFRRRGRLWRAAAILPVALALWFHWPYLKRPWRLVTWDPVPENRVEYRLTEWMARNMPGSRALATGSVRFWYNAWFDLPQIGGGSEQGLTNEIVAPAQWQLALGESAELARLWLVALGADAILVHEKASQEIYHDFVHPEKFRGAFPVAFDNGAGDLIYRVPRKPGLARLVNAARARSLKTPAYDTDVANLKPYAELLEASAAPAMRWEGTDAFRIEANVASGEALLALVTYDSAWRAYSGGRRLAIEKDAMGFMLIDAPPGAHDVRVVFELPLENAVGRVMTATSAALVIFLLTRRPRAR
jgi:hypothetical protein